MGAGVRIVGGGSGAVNSYELSGPYTAKDVESRGRNVNAFGEGENNEYGVLIPANGAGAKVFLGERHSVAVDKASLDAAAGGVFTHKHPDNSFGGSFSMTDLKVMAKSQLGEMRAFSKQGQLYSIKANANADRKGLSNWVNSHQKIYQKNFENSYRSALKSATTPLKSGPHKGMARIAVGRKDGKTVYKYVKPMTPSQADKYARQYSTGSFERAYKKALGKFGFTYTSTKAGLKK